MLDAIFRPVEAWPGEKTPGYKRQKARFGAKYSTTLDDLERELGCLKAKDVIVQCYFELKEIRNDGWPRSSASPSEPGVILTFSQGRDAISMPCDTFLHWHQNLLAIALTLNKLRMVNEYGVTKHNEQYQGFKRIAAPKSPDQMTVDEAAEFLELQSCISAAGMIKDPALANDAYKKSALRWHPDSPNGNHEMFVRAGVAIQILRDFHKNSR